jgi:hypothetical protein
MGKDKFLDFTECQHCDGDGFKTTWREDEEHPRGSYSARVQCEGCLELLQADALTRCGDHEADGCGCDDCMLVDAIGAIRGDQ